MRGPARFVRYHEEPEQTAQAIDPEGWFHSGDLGAHRRGGPALVRGPTQGHAQGRRRERRRGRDRDLPLGIPPATSSRSSARRTPATPRSRRRSCSSGQGRGDGGGADRASASAASPRSRCRATSASSTSGRCPARRSRSSSSASESPPSWSRRASARRRSCGRAEGQARHGSCCGHGSCCAQPDGHAAIGRHPGQRVDVLVADSSVLTLGRQARAGLPPPRGESSRRPWPLRSAGRTRSRRATRPPSTTPAAAASAG